MSSCAGLGKVRRDSLWLHGKLVPYGCHFLGREGDGVPCHPEGEPVLTAPWGWSAGRVGVVGGPTVTLGTCSRGILSQEGHLGVVVQLVKNPPAMWETWVRSLGWEDPLEKGKATHSSTLAWRIHILYSPWGRKESDTTERLSLNFSSRRL